MKAKKLINTKPGYIKTSLGWIPEEWSVKKVKEIGTVITGSTPKTTNQEYYNGSELFVTPADIQDNVYVNNTKTTLTKLGLQQGRLIPEESVLFVCIGSTIGKVSISGQTLITNQQINSIIPNNKIYSYFLFCILRYMSRRIRLLASNQAVPIINKSEFSIIKLPLPPLPEQKRIAEILSCWDEAIEKLEQLIAKKEELKKGLMQQLLTGKGMGWEEVELGELLDYEQPTKYLVKDTNYNDSFTTPVLTAGKTFILGNTNEEDGIYSGKPVIIFDDFTTASRLVDFPFKVKSSAIKLLHAKNENVNLKFVYESMQILKFVVGGHKRHWISKFAYLSILIPPIEEQIRIAQILQTADNEITLLKFKAEKLQEQKKGLMQQLLTGKTRVSV